MNRVRIAFGLLIVIVGTAWLLDGPAAIRSGGRWTLTALPYVLLGVGLFLLLRAAVPRGLLAAPVVLILIGVLWVVHDSGRLSSAAGRTWPGIVILLGAAIALGAAPAAARDREEGPLRRYRSVVMPVHPDLMGSAGPLQKVTVASYIGDVRLELSTVRFQADSALNSFGFSAEVLEIDVTVLFGRVTILLDHRCAVVKGNVANSLAVHFADQVRVYATTDIYADEALRTRTPRRILLNVIGVGGTVEIRSR